MLKIAINGYGRIGRCVLRALYDLGYRDRAVVVAVNDITGFDARVHLTRYDSTHGRLSIPVTRTDDCMVIGTDHIKLITEPDSRRLPWREVGAAIVFDCTGLVRNRSDALVHLEAGAGKVLLSYPGPGDVDITAVYGINHHQINAEHRIVSNASCTSNCAIPVLSIVNEAFGIERGSLTVVHSIMNDQPSMDSYFHEDPRRNRSGVSSIVPVDTRLAMGIARVLPRLKDRIAASAVRVPTLNVSAMDFALTVTRETNAKRVNEAIENASTSVLNGIMGIEYDPLVSVDFVHDSRSCVVDGTRTQVIDGRLLKLFAWFDNEWAYAIRMLDTALVMCNCEKSPHAVSSLMR